MGLKSGDFGNIFQFWQTERAVKLIKVLLLAAGLLLPGLFLCQNARAAVGFTITPATVSNTYSGKITLQVTGISSGGTVVIQKFLDANTNGAIGAGDYLVQQFSMTDGQASVFHDGSTAVTNFNVPGDTDSTAGQITAVLNFQNGDFSQNIVGKYLYRLSTSSGSLTNTFTVTNFPYAQSFTGSVFSNSSATVVSNAVVMLFQSSGNGDMNPVAGAVANNSGSYTIKAPVGTYLLAAVRSNFLANLGTAPQLTLGIGSTITTNLTLTNATQSISGKFVDSNTPAIGIPGFLVPVQSTNNFLAIGFTDTNGNFTVGTMPGVWKIENNSAGLAVHGYLASQNNIKTNTTAGSVSGLTNAVPKETAIFYGKVRDNLGNPLAGIDIQSADDNNGYQADGFTDTNGNYVAGALATNWNVSISTDKNPANYVFSEGIDTTLTNGQAQLCNFTAILATNQISGTVKDNGGNPITNVGVFANATINGTNYQTFNADTDTGGNYSLTVPNGTWSVSVNCNGDNDSLDNIIGGGNYICPGSDTVNISGGNAVTNFIVQLCSGVSITTTSPLPAGQNGSPYDVFLQASSCFPSFNWLQIAGSLPPGMTFETTGELHGTPGTNGTFNFTAQVTDGATPSHTNSQPFTLVIATNSPPPPTLNVVMSGNQAVVFYPQSGTNYVLQTTTNLVTGPWVPATNGVPVIALTFTNTAPAAFFRLH
jgi:hypothetical protein